MGNDDLLKRIASTVTKCQKCRLCHGRKNAVPGEGNPRAQIVFIGEGPGMNEDEQGRPFVGQSGALLSELLKTIRLTRQDVWIGNIVKCRPPDNREPMVDEIRACTPYLDDQLRAIKPKLVIPLGKFALEHFLKDSKISKDHGVPKKVGNFIIFPLYHPAAALRSENVKRVLKEDFLKIPGILNMDQSTIKVAGNVKKVDESQVSLF
ncbi:MAG: uracil-DNA glycosylase [candidate division WWE3 bacterium]|nr:uracil-DNA glycosylase [candidate division WWE3 bacterium]